jgi:hypothetical protein
MKSKAISTALVLSILALCLSLSCTENGAVATVSGIYAPSKEALSGILIDPYGVEYPLVVRLKPTGLAVAGRDYRVTLYKAGVERGTKRVTWNSSELDLRRVKAVIFNITAEECRAYSEAVETNRKVDSSGVTQPPETIETANVGLRSLDEVWIYRDLRGIFTVTIAKDDSAVQAANTELHQAQTAIAAAMADARVASVDDNGGDMLFGPGNDFLVDGVSAQSFLHDPLIATYVVDHSGYITGVIDETVFGDDVCWNDTQFQWTDVGCT